MGIQMRGLMVVMILVLAFFQVCAQESKQVVPEVKVGWIRMKPDPAVVGQPASIEALVSNVGGAGTVTVTFAVEGRVIQTESLFLKAGETTIIRFNYTPIKEGFFTVSVNEATASFQATLPLLHEKHPAFAKLHVDRDLIDRFSPAMVTFLFQASPVNRVPLHVRLRISADPGLFVYETVGGRALSPGDVLTEFDVEPGKESTLSMTIKADKSAEGRSLILRVSGEYYPIGNPQDLIRFGGYQVPIYVKEVVAFSPSSNDNCQGALRIGSACIPWWVVVIGIIVGGAVIVGIFRAVRA